MFSKTMDNATSASRGVANAYTSRERVLILLFSFLGTVFDGADFAIFLFFMVPLAHHFGVSLVDISIIQACSYVIGIVGGLIFGRIADRFGRRLGLTLTVAMFGIFTLLTAFATDYWTLMIVRILTGVGIGGEAGIAFAYVNEALPARGGRRGLMSGLLQSMFLVGIWGAAAMYSFCVAAYGSDAWRWAFGYLGCAAILAGFVRVFMPESRAWLAARDALVTGIASTQQIPLRLAEALRGGTGLRVVWCTLMLSFGFYGCYAVVTYSPAMWQTSFHLPAAEVARLGMVASITAGVAYPLSGILSDWKGRRWAYTFSSAFGVLAYVYFYFSMTGHSTPHGAAPGIDWLSAIVLSYLALQIGFSYLGIQGVWIGELFQTEIRATAQNFVYSTGRAIGGGGAPLLGLVVARSTGLGIEFAVAFGFIGAVGSLIFCRFLPETSRESS
ncbi:MFS transporter [Paraburkholderia elongata]|uniref:MFS transporter n=1 Tax=Paraburkholderia elongata TaxID=2675747 RepID=A0A972NIT9_9BURK|nr:MFS transporter [Paraburkholderia elongata]NPT53078.1 MFS transporter [Paraburkholderia elongata]